MKRIPLTRGQFTFIDDTDYDWLSQWKWYANWVPSSQSFYARRGICLNKKWVTIGMHRFILGLHFGDKREGDHQNHDTLDNRRKNLRIVSPQQNKWNCKTAKGYSWDKGRRRYHAMIKMNNRTINLGYYTTKHAAHAAYFTAKAELHRIIT